MGLFDIFTEPTKEELEEIEFEINSANYFQEDIAKFINKFGVINNRFIMETFDENNMVIYKYNPYNVKDYRFEKDPKNTNDKNAIKIVAVGSITNACVLGYIPREYNVEFAKLMKENKIYNVNLTIYGGDYKVISKNNIHLENTKYTVSLKVLFRKK